MPPVTTGTKVRRTGGSLLPHASRETSAADVKSVVKAAVAQKAAKKAALLVQENEVEVGRCKAVWVVERPPRFMQRLNPLHEDHGWFKRRWFQQL